MHGKSSLYKPGPQGNSQATCNSQSPQARYGRRNDDKKGYFPCMDETDSLCLILKPPQPPHPSRAWTHTHNLMTVAPHRRGTHRRTETNQRGANRPNQAGCVRAYAKPTQSPVKLHSIHQCTAISAPESLSQCR